DVIAGLPADLHGDPQPLYLSFAPQDWVADRHGLALRINERDDLPPTASDKQHCCDMSRGIGIRFMPTDAVVSDACLDRTESRLSLGADEVFEVFVGESDGSVRQPYTGSEISTEGADVRCART